MQDKRKKQRHHLIHYLRIFNLENESEVGNLVNITTRGLKVISEVPTKVNSTMRFRMDFPEEIMGKNNLEFDVKSVWCDADVNPDLYAIGFRLLRIPDDDKRILEYIIGFYEDDQEN